MIATTSSTIQTEMSDKEAESWIGVDLEWRTPPPPDHRNGNGVNGSRKRTWEDAATPINETVDLNWDQADLELLPDLDSGLSSATFGLTPEIASQNSNGSIHMDNGDDVEEIPRTKMQTGCIPCLIKGIKCDPSNPGCKMAMSDDWALNAGVRAGEDEDGQIFYPSAEGGSLTLFRPDMKWRRSWRERHCLNFFVNFSAPQMAGFFDSAFWQRMVIQTSYHEPAIRHAITAIGALHECIMQRAFADDKQKAKAMEFALNQCNKAISCLTADDGSDYDPNHRRIPSSRLALTTCVLFTCFEAMQGRCDSAVNHALQGRRLLHATGRAHATTMSPSEEDDIEQMRPLVERLEVQATALLDKGRRPEIDTSGQTPPLPPIDYIFSLEHAHNTLHTALNSVMRFMQGFHPTAPRDHIAVTMAEKYLRYAPWFSQWEAAFTAFLSDQRDFMSNMDLKRAMVLKANHLVGTMLASVDQSAGPVAYDAYEAEFRAIVDLAREVLASFSCPPLPTLSGPNSGTPYLSFSLWVTDPLWMAISRCRNPTIRQSAFTLLSRNPRQEGIWHAGPQLPNSSQYMRRVESGSTSRNDTVREDPPPESNDQAHIYVSHEAEQDKSEEMSKTEIFADRDWVDLRNQINEWTEESTKFVQSEWLSRGGNQRGTRRYKSHCKGRCCIPTLDEIRPEREDPGYLGLVDTAHLHSLATNEQSHRYEMRRPATSLAIEEMDIPGFDDLFGAMHLNHPSPNMPENRARRPGAFTRSRSSSSHSPLRGFFGHPTPLQDMMWDRRYYGPGPSHSPFPTGRVEELGDYDIPRSVSAHGMEYQDPHANSYSKPPPPYTPERRQSFEQAAASMYAALVTANQECRSIDKSFMDDVRNIMRWLPPSYMDSLWIIRVGWDGSLAKECAKPGLVKPDVTAVSYDSVVRRFSAALQGMKSSAPPANAPDSGQAFSWEVLRTTMRKLQISLEAIEELFQLTRNRRDRMPLLLHELASAIHLLESVRDVWENSNTRAGASKGKGRAEATPGPSTTRDFEWADFGGCGGNPTGPI